MQLHQRWEKAEKVLSVAEEEMDSIQKEAQGTTGNIILGNYLERRLTLFASEKKIGTIRFS